ncbi:MAG: hypothetical protein K2Y29_18955 [Beijerinckiaceae bacterium]|nr:hypothetical protein [Beijerinckiaceae bacterium]
MVHILAVATALAFVVCVGAAQSARALECDLLKGVYTPLDPEDDMSADAGKQNRYSARHVVKSLRFNQAKFAFQLAEANQKLSYDFGFAFANGYGGTSIVFAGPTGQSANRRMREEDPDSSIMYFDADMKVATPDWEKGGKAPQYLIMPRIGSAFWYWAPGHRKFVPPAGMWKLTGCEAG